MWSGIYPLRRDFVTCITGIALLGCAAALGLWALFSRQEPEGGLGPFCFEDENGRFRCRSKRWLCGCSHGECEHGDGIDWDALRQLDFTDGVVRMPTFRQEVKLPENLCTAKGGARVESKILVWLLGGTVEVKDDPDDARHACTQAPTHAWSEIELPRSHCYLMLGGQTSTFRDRSVHGFRVVLHDTTFRWWEREPGKLVYRGLLQHRSVPLSSAHQAVLRHIIDHGDRRLAKDVTCPADEHFERGLDQDIDLNPIFVEFPPARFVFKDNALFGMVTSYLGLFGLHRRLAFLAKPAMNCVMVALLFGVSPRELLSLLPEQAHQATRTRARALNEFWQHDVAPILKAADQVFQTEVEVPPPPAPWWWRLVPLQGSSRPEFAALDLQQQIERFRPAYLKKVLAPLKAALTSYDPALGQHWSRRFALTDELLEYKLDAFKALKNETVEGCEADSAVDQLLFCPDWRRTRYWQQARSKRGLAPLSTEAIVKETNIALRSLLYWSEASKVTGTTHP